MKKDNPITTLESVAKEVDEDSNVWKNEEEFYKRYDTLTEEDMRKTFTI